MSRGPAARLVLRWHHVAPAVLALALLGAWAAWRALQSRPELEPAASPDPPSLDGSVLSEDELRTASAELVADFPRVSVTLYWPRADGGGLVARKAEIFATQRTTDRAKQVVELLARGPAAPVPASGAPDEGSPDPSSPAVTEGTDEADGNVELTSPLPAGTLVRAAFVDESGIAYISLSEQVVSGAPGGSSWELSAVYSIVNSLVRSLPEVKRVQLLVEGQEVESIGGHLDATRPFSFSESVLAPSGGAP